jgi:hypothetical protein
LVPRSMVLPHTSSPPHLLMTAAHTEWVCSCQ